MTFIATFSAAPSFITPIAIPIFEILGYPSNINTIRHLVVQFKRSPLKTIFYHILGAAKGGYS